MFLCFGTFGSLSFQSASGEHNIFGDNKGYSSFDKDIIEKGNNEEKNALENNISEVASGKEEGRYGENLVLFSKNGEREGILNSTDVSSHGNEKSYVEQPNALGEKIISRGEMESLCSYSKVDFMLNWIFQNIGLEDFWYDCFHTYNGDSYKFVKKFCVLIVVVLRNYLIFVRTLIFFDLPTVLALSNTAIFLSFLVYIVAFFLIVYNPISYAAALVFLYFMFQRKKNTGEFEGNNVRNNFSRYGDYGDDVSTDVSETASVH